MNTVKRQLALLAMSLGGMFGRFGDLPQSRPNNDFVGDQTQGSRGGQSGRTKRDPRQRMRAKSGHGRKMHRRSYLSGKPGLRHI